MDQRAGFEGFLAFFKVPLKKWAIVFTKAGEKVVTGFVTLMRSQGPKMGIAVDMPILSALPNDVRDQLFNVDICAAVAVF
jgi:hypothetical protein